MIEMKIVNNMLANIPKYQTAGAAALDLHACIFDSLIIEPGETVDIGSGIAVNLTQHDSFTHETLAGILLPRSGKARKEGLILANTVGLIDNDYHGEIIMACYNNGEEPITIRVLERIAQLAFVPVSRPPIAKVTEFSNTTARDTNGFGSTGKH